MSGTKRIDGSDEQRDSMVFYRSFYEAINELPDKEKLEVYKAIFELGLNFNKVELSGFSKTVFRLIQPQIEANNKKFIDGSKGGKYGDLGGRPAKVKNPTKTPQKPHKNPYGVSENNPTETPNVNENVNENVNGPLSEVEKKEPEFTEQETPKESECSTVTPWAYLKVRKSIALHDLELKYTYIMIEDVGIGWEKWLLANKPTAFEERDMGGMWKLFDWYANNANTSAKKAAEARKKHQGQQGPHVNGTARDITKLDQPFD